MELSKIVITGGPCAGKSSAMAFIEKELNKEGYTVITIREVATDFILGGVAPWTTGTNLDYQICQCLMQYHKEKFLMQAIKTMPKDKILVICDRGLLDNRAYMNDDEYHHVLKVLNMSEEDILNQYDAIFHLESTAKGLKEFYTLENNGARIETAQEASILDELVLKAWSKHKNHYIIKNNKDFDIKMNDLITKIKIHLGIGE